MLPWVFAVVGALLVFAIAAAVLSGLLSPEDAYAGFANPTIVLIVVAFLVASAVVKCGLGARGGDLLGELRQLGGELVAAGGERGEGLV